MDESVSQSRIVDKRGAKSIAFAYFSAIRPVPTKTQHRNNSVSVNMTIGDINHRQSAIETTQRNDTT
jgi:hypothetical protein